MTTAFMMLIVTGVSTISGYILARFCLLRSHPKLSSLFLSFSHILFLMPPILMAGVVMTVIDHWGVATAHEFSPIVIVCIVHVFVFGPYCAACLYPVLQNIYQSPLRDYAGTLHLSKWQIFRMIEQPSLKPMCLSLMKRIAIMTVLSFSLVMIVGQGTVTTISVAIVQKIESAEVDGILGLLFLAQLTPAWFLRQAQNKDQLHKGYVITKSTGSWTKRSYLLPTVLTLGLIVAGACVSSVMITFVGAELMTDSLKTQVVWGMWITGSYAALTGGMVLLLSLMIVFIERKALDRFADLCFSLPKMIYVLVFFFIQHTLRLPSELNYILITAVFFMAYWGYGYRALATHVRQFQGVYAVYCQTLRLSPIKRLGLFWRMNHDLILKTWVEITCFVMGNVMVFLILEDGEQHILSILLYDALVQHDYKLANQAFAGLCVLLLVMVAVPKFCARLFVIKTYLRSSLLIRRNPC